MLCALSRKVGVMKMEWLHSSKWRGAIPQNGGGDIPQNGGGNIFNIWAGYSHYLGWIFPLSGLYIGMYKVYTLGCLRAGHRDV